MGEGRAKRSFKPQTVFNIVNCLIIINRHFYTTFKIFNGLEVFWVRVTGETADQTADQTVL